MYINSSMQDYSNGSGTKQCGTKTGFKYFTENTARSYSEAMLSI